MSGPGVKAANPSKEVKWFVGYTALCAGVDGRDASSFFFLVPVSHAVLIELIVQNWFAQ